MLIKYLRQDGTGDYTNITTAFDDMLVSGVAATGLITEYLLDVDGGSYSGTLSGYIPYSGTFNIIGSGAYLYLVSGISTVSGEYASLYTPNLNIENFIIDCSGVPNNWFTMVSGFGLQLKNVQLINNISGIVNSCGNLQITGSDSCGISGRSTYFLYDLSGSLNIISDTTISNFGTGILSKNIVLLDSVLYNNKAGIYYDNGYSVDIIDSLFYDNITDINVGSGNIYLNRSTFNSPIYINGAFILANRIISSNTINISGAAISGSIVENSCLYPGSPLHTNISGSYNINTDPKFNDVSNRDYRLQFKQTEGSPCVEIQPNLNVDSSVSYNLDGSKLRLFDDRGMIHLNEFLGFVYSQDDTLVFSDINKEIIFAEKVALFKNLRYQIFVDMLFDEYNVLTTNSFDPNINNDDYFPWDWDNINISTTQITNYNQYIIPRSIVNIETLVNSKIGILPNSVFYSEMDKNNIKVFNKVDFRGIAYDFNSSVYGRNIIWVIDGTNQSLIKQDLYTGEQLEYYPLLCATATKSTIRPSGIIYTGVRGDYYTFIRQDEPDTELIALTELGDFYWIPSVLDSKHDLRGIKCYRDDLFISASQYPVDVTDRTIIPSGNPIGKILQYNNNDLFFNYIKRPGETNGPLSYTLASGNFYPTDLTIYEDGTLFVADYFSTSGLYKYDLAYDYCIINSAYDNETRVLLREQYDDVNF